MNTNESIVYQGLSGLLRNNVLAPIVNYLPTRTNQGPVTVDELAGVLKLVSVSNAPSNVMPTMSAPSLNTNFASNMMPAGFPPVAGGPPTLTTYGSVPLPAPKKGRGKTGAPVAPPPDNERCQYKITRGRNKDQRCEGRAEPGQPFCSSCKSKKSAQQQLQNGITGNTGVSMGQSFGNLPGVFSGMPMVNSVQAFNGVMPGGMLPNTNQFNPAMSSTLTNTQEQPRLQAQQLSNGLLLEKSNNLVLKTGEKPNEYICCGVMPDPKSGIIQALTADKIEVCKKFGISYIDPTKTDGSTVSATQQNTLPSMSGQMFPNVNQQLPTVNNMFSNQGSTLPSVPSLGVQGVSGLPTLAQQSGGQQFNLPQMSGIGALPGVPAITDMHNVDDPEGDDDEDDADDSNE